MPATRRVLKHLAIEAAKARRKCYRKQEHAIRKGEACLVVREDSGLGKKNYCSSCAAEILQQAQADLDRFTIQLGLPT
jgi:hypothetical protein